MQHNTLRTLQNLSFPGSNLLTVQLMYEETPLMPSGKVDFKPKHWYFLTLAPGEGNGPNNRTYNFQNKINIKFSITEILSLSFILHSAAVGNINSVVGYSKFARSTETKSVSVAISEKNTKYGNQRVITLFISSGGAKYSFPMDCGLASAISKQLEWSCETANKLEITRVGGQTKPMQMNFQ